MSYGDEAFVYDDYIGNPTTYRGKSASWTHGRELTSYNGTTFTYDARGRREKKKKQNETAITFTYDSNGNLIKQNNGLEFFYDHTGVFAFKYNNFTYFYRKNAQNDVIAILDNTGDTVVKYVYDAWGNHKILDASGVEITDDTHIGVLNPFRYRSYYYDTETKLYFLKTRYYDPEIGRFITIDDISYLDPETINGLNLYAYCGNNPINKYDPSGHFAISIGFLIASILIGAAFGAGISGAIAYSEGERGWDLVWDIAGGAVMGAATGAIIALGGAAGLGAVAGTAVAGVNVSLGAAIGISIGGMAFANATKYSLDCAASDNQWSLGGYMLASVEGAAQGAATFFIANVGGKAGLFNKLANFKTPDVFFTPQYGGINSLRAFVWGSKVLIGETLSKAVLVSGTSALARKLIDLIIPDLY